jgi:hypothetical protein
MESLLQLIILAAALTGLYATFRASFWLGVICLLLAGVPYAIIGAFFWFGVDLPAALVRGLKR